MFEFKMPSLGADMEAAILVEWYVKPGDEVKRGDLIADLETDKGDIDVEVYEDGTIKKLMAQPGDKLPVGTVMAIIDNGQESDKRAQRPEAKSFDHELNNELEEIEELRAEKNNIKRIGRVRASPLARKIARDRGIEIARIKGTGVGGSIHKTDVINYLDAIKKNLEQEEHLSKKPQEATSKRMRVAIAAAMSKSNREIPHYYLEMPVDMSRSLSWLERENGTKKVKDRILLIALEIKAMAKALAEIPQLNGYWKDDCLEIQESINVGLAISLRQGGLVIPSINNADLKSVEEVMTNVMDLTLRTRSGKLRTSELSSATITLTNLGDQGVKTVFGIIYPPQVALVGMGRVLKQPWVENEMIGIKPIVNMTLAGDHRATDGHLGARFIQVFNRFMQKPETL